MEIKKIAMAGTVESCDVQVTIEPASSGRKIEIMSDVINQYGKQIREVVIETLDRLDVKSCIVNLVDKGALNCTIKARVEAAVYRSSGQTDNIPWGGAVR